MLLRVVLVAGVLGIWAGMIPKACERGRASSTVSLDAIMCANLSQPRLLRLI